jgi:hypothetical protein
VAVTGGQWSVLGGSAGGTIDANGTFHAPASIPIPATVSVAYVLGGNTYSSTVTITASANSASIVVQPNSATVQVNGSDAFSATQQGVAVTGGQWSVLGGSAGGTIDANGTFHAPASIPIPAIVSVAYVLDGNTFSSTVTIVNATPVIASISPSLLQQIITPIQITGSGFTLNSVVTINSIPTQTTYIDSTHLDAIIALSDPVNTTLQVAISNPGPNQTASSSVTVTTAFPNIVVKPSTLTGGNVSITITGSTFVPGEIVFLAGNPLKTVSSSSTQITATGYLAPWTSGSALVELIGGDGTSKIAAQSVPINPTATTYDAAARFSTQAAFGPRPDLVEHIQQIGFDAFITEQFSQASIGYTADGQHAFILAATTGNSLLRQRVALALQSFIVPHGIEFSPSSTYFETKLETDANANFRTLLGDIAGDPNIGIFLNLVGNQVSTSPLVQPNQNFARELMQLFTLGPMLLNDDGSVQMDANGNPIPTYTQDTVIDLTRALTGWSYPVPVNPATTAYGVDYSQVLAANEGSHDHNAKLLFGAVILPAGQSITQDRDMALDAIFNHPNLPPVISHLLIQRLVKSNPSPAYIERIAKVFEDNGSGSRGDLGAVVRAILLDPEARLGDTQASSDDGFLQEPLLFQLFLMNALQAYGSDDQEVYLAGDLGEPWWFSPTVFGSYSPTYNIPGTSINSPEFKGVKFYGAL